MTQTRHDYGKVLDFWFGHLDTHGCADEAHRKSWFTKDDAFDAAIRAQFAGLHAAALRGECEDWLTVPHGRLAFIILLDQFSRNLYRDSAQMFAADPVSLQVAVRSIDEGDDNRVAFDERSFLYMPLMHAENIELQDRCVALFATSMAQQTPGKQHDLVAYSLEFAEKHRDIIRRFGRFPHRNALLGRESTPEEVEFLNEPGSSF